MAWHNISFLLLTSLLDQQTFSNDIWRNHHYGNVVVIRNFWIKAHYSSGYHLLVMREKPFTVKCEVSLWLPPVPVSPAYEDESCWEHSWDKQTRGQRERRRCRCYQLCWHGLLRFSWILLTPRPPEVIQSDGAPLRPQGNKPRRLRNKTLSSHAHCEDLTK